MKKFLIIILCIAGASVFQPLSAQLEVKVLRSEFRIKQSGFRAAWSAVQEGDRYAKKGIGALSLALNEYLKAHAYNPDNAELNFKIGTCCLKTDKKRDAITYLSKAYFSNPQIIPEIHLLLAQAYHQNMEFSNAIKEYEFYYQSLSRKDKKTIGPVVLKYKQECLHAGEIVNAPKRVIIKNLGDSINSPYDDYNPVISANDSVMYFISRRPSNPASRPNILDYRFNEDIYSAVNDSGTWRNVNRWAVKFNNKHHNGVVWISPDGRKVYLYNGFRNNGDLEYTELKKGKWTKPSKVRGGIGTSDKETSFTMNADGTELYFVSSDQRESFGGKDIFYSVKNSKGKWSSPKNVGSSVNTMYDEEGVYIQPDGKVMYFSSKGHNSIGGYDIFRVERDERNVWLKPQNIGYPVNTPDDELFYRPVNEKQAYYSASRPDSRGGKDIYKVIFLGAEKEMILLSEDQLISYKDKPYTDIFVRLPITVSVDTSVTLTGVVADAGNNAPLVAKINLIDLERSQIIATAISGADGNYRISLPSVKNYGVEINARDYMFLLDVIAMPEKIEGREIVKNFSMSKVEVGAKVILKNIYFETGKATLKEESFAELDKVIKFLQENRDLKIEISGHTDNVGTLKANSNLSEARAKAVVEYLASHGVESGRLVYKGYAFNQPIAPNNTPAGRQMNRRVEFKILSRE